MLLSESRGVVCYPIFDCKFKNTDWMGGICCVPPTLSAEDVNELGTYSRRMMKADYLSRDIEFLLVKNDVVTVGLLTWMNKLLPDSDIGFDKAGRRLPVLAGVSYVKSDGIGWVAPTRSQIVGLFRTFISDGKWESEKMEYYTSEEVLLELCEMDITNKKYGLEKKKVSKPSTHLFDAMSNASKPMLYYNQLPKNYKVDGKTVFMTEADRKDKAYHYSYRSFFNGRSLIKDD